VLGRAVRGVPRRSWPGGRRGRGPRPRGRGWPSAVPHGGTVAVRRSRCCRGSPRGRARSGRRSRPDPADGLAPGEHPLSLGADRTGLSIDYAQCAGAGSCSRLSRPGCQGLWPAPPARLRRALRQARRSSGDDVSSPHASLPSGAIKHPRRRTRSAASLLLATNTLPPPRADPASLAQPTGKRGGMCSALASQRLRSMQRIDVSVAISTVRQECSVARRLGFTSAGAPGEGE
jgi:hypothetical protein